MIMVVTSNRSILSLTADKRFSEMTQGAGKYPAPAFSYFKPFV